MLKTLALLATVASLALPSAAAARSRSEEADEAFASAKEAYLSLKADSKRRRFRDNWTNIAAKFERVADRYSDSPRAADALYNAAKLYSDLYRVSLNRRDLRSSMDTWARLYTRYPKSNLADDAHVERARIFRDRKGDIATARAELQAAVEMGGDKKSEARRELAALGPVTREERGQPIDMPGREKAAPKTAVASAGKAEPRKTSDGQADDEMARRSRLMESIALVATGDSEENDEEGEAVASPAAPAPVAEPTRAAEPPPAAEPTKVAAREEIEEQDEPADDEKPGMDRDRLARLKQASRGEVPLPVQLGLKVKRVVIDPGHGGHDTGAIGPSGVREKDVALSIAVKLKAQLEADGLEAILTRDDDTFLALEDRARLANRKKGDLFVSIHCNAMKNRKFRGTETYTLNVSSDKYAIRLAARENASSERSLSDLQFILADLATKANTDESTRLARAINARVVDAMRDGKTPAKDLGVKQALFYVLLGVRMPSVLVETAFISNPRDEKRLDDAAQQQKIAEAIASGVVRFVAEREALASALSD